MSLDEFRLNFLLTYFCNDCEILWQDRWDSTPDSACPMCHVKNKSPFIQDGDVSWEWVLAKEIEKERAWNDENYSEAETKQEANDK